MSLSIDGSSAADSGGNSRAGVVSLAEFAGLRGAARDAALMVVHREIARLTALEAAMIAVVDRSGSFVDDGHHSPRNWLQAVTNSSRTTAQAAVLTARLHTALPAVAVAAADGTLGADQVRLLTRLYANDRCRPLLADSESLLVGHGRSLTLRDFATVVRRWQAHADPDGGHHDHELSRANRHVRRHRVGAGHIFHAEGDALTGDDVDQILDAFTEREFNIDTAERTHIHGDDADQHPLRRSARQRTYDALVAIFRTAAGTPHSTDRVPHVNILCTEDVLTTAIRDHFATTTTRWPSGPGSGLSGRLRMCETASGAPVDPADLVVAALIGNVRRIVVDPVGRVINHGRRRRLFTGAAREAALLTGGHCTHPGCEQRVGLQIDHITPWASRAGPTDLHNATTLCRRHNIATDRHQFTIHRDETGWHHHRPDGTEIAPRNPDPPSRDRPP